MKNKEIIFPALGGLIVILLTMFNTEVKLWLVSHWRIILFFFGLSLIALSIISWWIRFVFNRIWKEHLDAYTNEISGLNKKIDNVIESYSTTAIFAGITNRISRDFIYKNLDRDSLINALLDDSYSLSEVQAYRFDAEFIKEFLIKAHEREIERVKNLKNKTNEPNIEL
jgi:hypothetical protein